MPKKTGIFINRLAALVLFSTFAITGTATPARSDTKVIEEDAYYHKLDKLWRGVDLNRQTEHWRAPEFTPGPFLSRQPAAEGVWVSCDRWPDGSDARRFGLDAIRLSNARTDHEKALAVYRWVRRWMIYNNKAGSSVERLVTDTSRNPVVNQADKLLNVYGVHWCGGQARVVEQVWRALGYRAEKVVRGSHTIVGMHYRDDDGIERWHGLDVSHSHVAWDNSYQRLLSLDELSSRWYSFYYQYGLPGNGHLYFNDHRMELSFRTGEKLERFWDNLGKPYQDNAASGDGMAKRVPDYERGPYLPFTYGNGRWSYSPDLSDPNWQDGLAEPASGMQPGRLEPAEVGVPASASWHFRTPYIISDAAVKLNFYRQNPADRIRLLLSKDNGKTWQLLWNNPDNLLGSRQLTIPIAEKFRVTEKGKAPDKDFNSPFGRYSYRLKLELESSSPQSCRVEGISFETVVQLNSYSLPQLQPGINTIDIRGKLTAGSALRVTYLWDDPAGQERRNVTHIEQTPYSYEIIAGGRQWEDCITKSITIEAVPATGHGNHTLVKERPADFADLPPLPPVEETMGRWNGQPLERQLPSRQKILSALADQNAFKRQLRPSIMLNVPEAFDALQELSYREPSPNTKFLAFTGMYQADPDRARPVLLDILNDRAGKRVVWSKGKDKSDIGWGRELSWTTGGTVIGYIAAEAGWTEFLPGLLKVLASDQCKHYWGPRYGTVRVIGKLGQGDPEAARAIRDILEQNNGKEHGDTLIVATLAAGRIGDKAAIPSLRTYLADDYWPLKHNAALALAQLGDRGIVPRMQEWLSVKFDENFRGYAAEALGILADKGSISHLQATLGKEPFPWVRQKIETALHKIAR